MIKKHWIVKRLLLMWWRFILYSNILHKQCRLHNIWKFNEIHRVVGVNSLRKRWREMARQGQCCVDLLGSSLIILSRIELHFFLWTVMSWTQHWTGSDEKQTWHGEAVSLNRLCPRCLCLKFGTRKLREDGETDDGVAWILSVAWGRPLFVNTFKGTEDAVKEVLIP